MSVVRKILWGIFVGLAGLFSGVMVERGLKTVYDPNKTEDAKDANEEPEEATEAPTETNCESSVAESEVEKGSDDVSKSNEE